MACLCFCGNKSAQFCWELFVFLFVWSLENTQQVHKKCNSFSCKNWMNRCTTLFCHHRLVQFSKAFALSLSIIEEVNWEVFICLRNIYLLLVKTLFVCTYIISPYPKQWMWLYFMLIPLLRPVKVSTYLRWSTIGIPVLHNSFRYTECNYCYNRGLNWRTANDGENEAKC